MKTKILALLAPSLLILNSCATMFGTPIKSETPHTAIIVKNNFNDGSSVWNRQYEFPAGRYTPSLEFPKLFLYQCEANPRITIREMGGLIPTSHLGGILVYKDDPTKIKGGHRQGEVIARGSVIDSNIVERNIDFVE